MFVGHGLLAFAIAASVAAGVGWHRDRALVVGLLAGLFATLPDIDILYAVASAGGHLEGVVAAHEAFWDASNRIHRTVTHSVVVGAVAAVGFAAWRGRADRRLLLLGTAVLGGLIWGMGAVGGSVTAVLVAVFVLGGLAIVTVAEHVDVGPRLVGLTALLGVATHPFGDLLTGEPPHVLYPFEIVLAGEQVSLHPDPTLHLLGAFFVELGVIWLALLVVARLQGWRLRDRVRSRGALGVAYAGAVFAVPTPTLETSSPFVFSVLAVGMVGLPVPLRDQRLDWRTVTTALTAVTLAGLAYAGAYLLL